MLYSFGLTEKEQEKKGHSPPDLRNRGRGAPNQFLRRGGRAGEREGHFRGLWGWENGAVRGLGQV